MNTTTTLLDEVHACFAQNGLLSETIPGFHTRSEQQTLSQTVAEAIQSEQTLVCEAGTGTGKTFAYLVPALLSGQKVVVSTGTRHLQDQLYHRDLPLIRDALSQDLQCEQLKGRSNYLCLHRLQHKAPGSEHAEWQRDWHLIQDWAELTREGDIAELSEVPEQSAIWSLATSNSDNCLGRECPEFEACHVFEARRRALDADVLVINHYLLGTQLNYQTTSNNDWLADAGVVIIDEAHRLPDVAARFLGTSMGSRYLNRLADDIVKAQKSEARDMSVVLEDVEDFREAIADLHQALPHNDHGLGSDSIRFDRDCQHAIETLLNGLEALDRVIRTLVPRGRLFEHVYQRLEEVTTAFNPLQEESDQASMISWWQVDDQHWQWHQTPMRVADRFSPYLHDTDQTWIFASATLADASGFRFFIEQMGLDDPMTLQLDSPFDHDRQALLYLPKGLPDPNDETYTSAMMEAVLPVIEASGGRCFCLFTSHRAMQLAEAYLQEHCEYPLLVQGAAPRRRLLEQFEALGNAVLLGSASFWEGVDVKGDALSCVIIDKIPFTSPEDPVLKARMQQLKRLGGNPFMQLQIPQASLALKQGVGRLIRDIHDRGIVVLADPRVSQKNYGKLFLRSLPTMAMTHELADVTRFFDVETV